MQTNLSGANFTGARLRNAVLMGARLGEANLSIADEQAVRVEICRVLLNPPILASGAEYWLD